MNELKCMGPVDCQVGNNYRFPMKKRKRPIRTISIFALHCDPNVWHMEVLNKY